MQKEIKERASIFIDTFKSTDWITSFKCLNWIPVKERDGLLNIREGEADTRLERTDGQLQA